MCIQINGTFRKIVDSEGLLNKKRSNDLVVTVNMMHAITTFNEKVLKFVNRVGRVVVILQ